MVRDLLSPFYLKLIIPINLNPAGTFVITTIPSDGATQQ